MTDLRKAAEMALPLLVAYQDYTGDSRIANKCGEAIEALRQALADQKLADAFAEDFPNTWGKKKHTAPPSKPDDLLRQSEQEGWRWAKECEAEVKRLRALLAKSNQEPVAWMYVNKDGECEQIEYGEAFGDPSVTPLYTAPPKREWVGLTYDEAYELFVDYDIYSIGLLKATEAKLKEKNNG